MRHTTIALLLASAAALFACGGSQPAAGPATPESASTASAEGSPAPAGPAGKDGAPETTAQGSPSGEVDFDSLSTDKKAEIMMTKVVPDVGKLFKEHNAKKFGKFDCTTCHGPQKKDDPHKVLPKLTLSNGGMEKLSKSKPEMMKFMSEKVVPAMAAAIGEKPFDPATKKGFGCAGCHAID